MPIPSTQIAETVQKTLSEGSANIQSTLQRTLSDPQVQQLKSTLTANLHTLQENVHHLQENVVTGVHHLQESLPNLQNPEARDKLLGGARKQGEDWLKQAGEFIQDAVKVVPPEPGQAGYQPGMIWDGSDVWMFSEAREDEAAAADQKGKSNEGISVSRTGALLRKLRTDPEMLRAVPSGETYEWFCGEINAKDGGLGGDEWKKKCEEVEKLDGLKALRESLVPSELDEETFWRRYWFRAWQIQQEEEKRKALLQGSVITSPLWNLLDSHVLFKRRLKRKKRKCLAGKMKTRRRFNERQNHPQTTLIRRRPSLPSPLSRQRTNPALANQKTLTTWSAHGRATRAAVGCLLVYPIDTFHPVALVVLLQSLQRKRLPRKETTATTAIGTKGVPCNTSGGVM